MPWLHRTRRRVLPSLVALTALTVYGVCIIDATLPVSTLTTSCSELCAQVTGAMACVNLKQADTNTCRATQQIESTVTCAVDATAATNRTALCIAPPDAHAWSFRFTDDVETLALARTQNPTLLSGAKNVVVLDAANVDSIKELIGTSAVWSLTLKTDRSPPTLKLDADTLATWSDVEMLYVKKCHVGEWGLIKC